MHAFVRLFAAGLCAAAACAAQAQVRSVQPAPNRIPDVSAGTARAAPDPSGLQPRFPAGVSSGSGARVSTDPIARDAAPVPPSSAGRSGGGAGGGVGGGVVVRPDLPPGPVNTTVLGAGTSVRGPGERLEGGAGGFSAVDEARSFFFADADHDGELTRAEAGRLSIMTLSFEEMDRNYDQVISRFEYEDSLR